MMFCVFCVFYCVCFPVCYCLLLPVPVGVLKDDDDDDDMLVQRV